MDKTSNTPTVDAGARQPMVKVPTDILEARAQGRAEALALLLQVDMDTFCNEYVADGGSLPSGERDEGWDEEKLRELFSADDSAYSLMQSAEAEYWHNVGLREDAEIVLKQVREQRAALSASTEAATISIQEAWEAAGGNPGIKATREELLTALRDLDAVADGVPPKGSANAPFVVDQSDPLWPKHLYENMKAAYEHYAANPQPASTEAAPRTYTTQPGESVMGIAHRECGNEAEWRHILACNPQFADLLPHDYFPVGTVLALPIQKKPLPVLDLEPVVSDELHPDTAKLVRRFARALGNKLLSSQRKYGYSNEWANDDWMDRCREDLIRHVRKGDPRDVAAYCAFLWHHDQSTVPAANLPDLKLADELLDERIKAAERATGIYWFVPDDSERYLWRTINTDQQRKFARALLRASSATASNKESS